MVKNFLIMQKKSTTDAVKAVSKRAVQKTEATGDLIGSTIADKITNVSKKSSRKLNYKIIKLMIK